MMEKQTRKHFFGGGIRRLKWGSIHTSMKSMRRCFPSIIRPWVMLTVSSWLASALFSLHLCLGYWPLPRNRRTNQPETHVTYLTNHVHLRPINLGHLLKYILYWSNGQHITLCAFMQNAGIFIKVANTQHLRWFIWGMPQPIFLHNRYGNAVHFQETKTTHPHIEQYPLHVHVWLANRQPLACEHPAPPL